MRADLRDKRTQNKSRVVVLKQITTFYGSAELQHNNGHWTVVTMLKRTNDYYLKTERKKFHQDKAAAFAFYDAMEREFAIKEATRAMRIKT